MDGYWYHIGEDMSFLFFSFFFFSRWVPPPTSCHRFGSGESAKKRVKKKQKYGLRKNLTASRRRKGEPTQLDFLKAFFSLLFFFCLWPGNGNY